MNADTMNSPQAGEANDGPILGDEWIDAQWAKSCAQSAFPALTDYTAAVERAIASQAIAAALASQPECQPDSVHSSISVSPHAAAQQTACVMKGDCPNLRCTYEGMDGERYRCDVCGHSYFLDYDEMR